MKKILFMCLLLVLMKTVFAGGGITHMFIARQAIKQIPDTTLRNLLNDNLDAYLIGAYYPDSGYVRNTHYGEDSHWDEFIYNFADYIKEKYKDPILENPRLLAFLFGCATHRVSDEIMHQTFYPQIAANDFHGNKSKAHTYGDEGIDLLVNIDKDQWKTEPKIWWVPVSDLLRVYHRMGKDQYTAKEIIWGNSVIFAAGIGERWISPVTYYFLHWRMPWTAKNYEKDPKGGLRMDEQKIVDYTMNLWQRIIDKPSLKLRQETKIATETEHSSISKDFAEHALSMGIMQVKSSTEKDGSIELSSPVITEQSKFLSLIHDFIKKIKNM